MGPARRRTSTTASSRSTSSRRRRRAQVAKLQDAAERRRRALPRHGRGPRGRGHRLAPAGDAQAEGARSGGWCSTRSPEPAIRAAAANPRELDDDLVDAQETRRILDRLYGYEVSPVLWKKVMPKLSAGRVQSVATRIIVQRERERMAFRRRHLLGPRRDPGRRRARPTPRTFQRAPGHRRRATGWPPAATSTRPPARLKAGTDVLLLDEDGARTPRRGSCRAGDRDRQLRRGEAVHPQALRAVHDLDAAAGGRPQAAASSAERTMRTAQRLYENGYITYMRTDSTTLSRVGASRPPARRPASSTATRVRARRAAAVHPQGQERAGGTRGHPAGRGDVPHPGPGRPVELDGDEFRLYELIWQRTIASQMVDARGHHAVSVRITGTAGPARSACSPRPDAPSPSPASCRPTSRRSTTEAGGEADDAESPAAEADRRARQLDTRELIPAGHATTPPARYTEPSLIKALEELGIGRPSTYTSIIRTIHRPRLRVEEGPGAGPVLDRVRGDRAARARTSPGSSTTTSPPRWRTSSTRIADGRIGRTDWLTAFYFGGDAGPRGLGGRAGGLKKLVGVNGWRTSTPARSTRCRCSTTRGPAGRWSGSAGTGRTWSG